MTWLPLVPPAVVVGAYLLEWAAGRLASRLH